MRDNGSNFWTGFFIGAAIGAAAGLTFTPVSGSELRQRISSYGSQVRTRASQVPSGVQETREKSRSYLGGFRSRLSQAVQAGREAAREKRLELQKEVQAVTEPKPSM